MFFFLLATSDFDRDLSGWEALDFRRSKGLPDGECVSKMTGATGDARPCSEEYCRALSAKEVAAFGNPADFRPVVNLDIRKVPSRFLSIDSGGRISLKHAEIFDQDAKELVEIAADWSIGNLQW